MSYKEYTVRVFDNGDKLYLQNGKLHREDGPASEWVDGNKFWYQDGQRHREDGPAVEYANGDKSWYQHGFLHKEDGPAVEFAGGNKYWYLNGVSYSEKEFLLKVKKDNCIDNTVVIINNKKYKLVEE